MHFQTCVIQFAYDNAIVRGWHRRWILFFLDRSCVNDT